MLPGFLAIVEVATVELQISTVSKFAILLVAIIKCQVMDYKLLSRKFHDKNCHDYCKITKIFDHGSLKLYSSSLNK